jgi:hypothetical protein
MAISRALVRGARTITTGKQLRGQFDGTSSNGLRLATHVGPNALLRSGSYPKPNAESLGPLTQIALPEGYTGWRIDTSNPQEWNGPSYWTSTTAEYSYNNSPTNLGGIIPSGGMTIDGYFYEAGTQVCQFMDFSLGGFLLEGEGYGFPMLFRGCRWRNTAYAPGAWNCTSGYYPIAFHYCDIGAVGAADADICEAALKIAGPVSDLRIYRCYISYVVTAIQLNNSGGGYSDAIENYIEKLTFFYGEEGPPSEGTPEHMNGIALNGGNTNCLVRRNSIVIVTPDEAPSGQQGTTPHPISQTDCIAFFWDITGEPDVSQFPGTGTNSDGTTGYQVTGNYLGGTGFPLYPPCSGSGYSGDEQPATFNMQNNLVTATIYPPLELSGTVNAGGGSFGPVYPGMTWGENSNTQTNNLWSDGEYAGLPLLAYVQDVSTAGAGTDQEVTITTTAGNTLVACIVAFSYSDATALAISSVTDSAGNIWHYSTAPSSQSPPANGSWDSAGGGYYGFAAIAYCVNAAAVTSVTVTLNADASDSLCVDVQEYSFLGPHAAIDGAASAGTLESSVTSYSTPSITTTTNGGLVVACSARGTGWTGVSPSQFTLFSASASHYVNCAVAMNTTAGSWSADFTGASQDAQASAILGLGYPLFFDDFNGTEGTLPNSEYWNVNVTSSGNPYSNYGEYDSEAYVDSTSILYQDGDSNLVFMLGEPGTYGAYTAYEGAEGYPSGRVDTSGGSSSLPAAGTTPRFAVQPGQTCNIRAAIWPLQGAWPALWFIGVDAVYPTSWAEIDMQESGDVPTDDAYDLSYVTIWGAGASTPTRLSTSDPTGFTLTAGEYNVWSFQFISATEIAIAINGTTVYDLTKSSLSSGLQADWEFPSGGMFIVMNVACATSQYGTPSGLPAKIMAVDYVEVVNGT